MNGDSEQVTVEQNLSKLIMCLDRFISYQQLHPYGGDTSLISEPQQQEYSATLVYPPVDWIWIYWQCRDSNTTW